MSDQISELDPEHWLYDDIVFAMWPSDGEGKQHHDAKTGKTYPSSGTMSAGNRAIDENGEYLELTPSSALSSAHYINLGQPPELEALNDAITVLVGYKRTDNQDSGYGRLITRNNGTTGDYWGLAQETNAAGSNLRWRVNNGAGGSTNIYSTTAMALNEYHDIATIADDPNNNVEIFVDGVSEASSTQVDLLQGRDVVIGSIGSSGSRNLYGDLYYVIIVGRALSAEEIAEFTRNVDSVRLQEEVDFEKITVDVGVTVNCVSVDIAPTVNSAFVEVGIDVNTSSVDISPTVSTALVEVGIDVNTISVDISPTVNSASVEVGVDVNTVSVDITPTINQAFVDAGGVTVNCISVDISPTIGSSLVEVGTDVNTVTVDISPTINQAIVEAGGVTVNCNTVSLSLAVGSAIIEVGTTILTVGVDITAVVGKAIIDIGDIIDSIAVEYISTTITKNKQISNIITISHKMNVDITRQKKYGVIL